ncbi:hypothetical protein DFP72DRAFT_448948 [Ephemerocybe angulata]|uniref:NACHT domain-containing protein n=1 Tax=Ephemerocybe angulata TaxID=980116 RepID=A0A8H6HVM0_9AGAR|nr:hypothetical protein DFP72DRAFT_448948 [Tulosesus angulatus]
MQSQTNEGAHFFQGAHNIAIDTQYNIGQQNIINHGDRGLLEMLNPIPDASYARNREVSPPNSRCLPGTREKVIKRVTGWVDSSLLLNNSHVMWLYGYVGCGKSAIAQAVAETFARRKRLAASFFFFRGAGDRGTTSRFAATIASQVAAMIPSTAPYIAAALKAHAGLLSQPSSLATQFQRLVYDPIEAIKWDNMGLNLVRKPFIIVIDGLDECSDKEQISHFIDHMLEFFKRNPRIPLRFFITSRVEEHIRTHLKDSHQVQLVNLLDHTTDSDIEKALHATFVLAAKHDRVIEAYGNWPTPEDLHQLVQHTGCSFIFMATIAKFILHPSNDGLTPMDRLPLALSIDPGLDDLYAQTLSQAQHLPHFKEIIQTLVWVAEPLSIIELADLLSIKTYEVVQVLVELHAVLQVPGDDRTPVTFCHTSLRDFLTDVRRSRYFYASQSHHERLARCCVGVLAKSVEGSKGETPAFRYAMSHWSNHLKHTMYDPEDDVDETDPTHGKRFTKHTIALFHQEFPPYFDLVVAAYILVDFKLLLTKPRRLSRPQSVESAQGALFELLQPRVPIGHSRMILAALTAGTSSREELCRDLRDVWMQIAPQPRPLESFHRELAEIGIHHLLFANPSPTPFYPHQVCFRGSELTSRSHIIFAWLFFNWTRHLTHALDHDQSMTWKSFRDTQIPVRVLKKPNFTNLLLHRLVDFLSPALRDEFIGDVKLAVQAMERAFHPNVQAMVPGNGHRSLPVGDWEWEPLVERKRETHSGDFGSRRNKTSLFDVLAAFVKLAELLGSRIFPYTDYIRDNMTLSGFLP